MEEDSKVLNETQNFFDDKREKFDTQKIAKLSKCPK